MGYLYLLRHAKTETGESDHERALMPRGHDDAAKLRHYLHTHHIVPALVLVSSARRTWQTCDALAFDPTHTDIRIARDLYLADADKVLALIRGVAPGTPSVMVIGHNPSMHQLAASLAGLSLNPTRTDTPLAARLGYGYPTTTLTEFTVTGAWADLAPAHAQLTRLVSPIDLTN